jgi:uncharacterized protein YqeY
MLIDDIKAAMFAAMKAGKTVEKELLRTAIGEATATGEKPDDAQMTALLRKFVKGNEETRAAATDAATQDKLAEELAILKRYLPQTLSVEQIQVALEPVLAAIRGAAGEGQATGVAMKHLKSTGALAEGKDVSAAVKALRA